MQPKVRKDAIARLKRIEGQVRGVLRMVEEGRDCPEILQQIASVQEAIRRVGDLILESHLKYCTENFTADPDLARQIPHLVKAALTYRR